MSANLRLKAWLKAAQVSQAEMARRCDYDRSNFHRVLGGTLTPSLLLAANIERETAGVIPATAWVEQSQAAA